MQNFAKWNMSTGFRHPFYKIQDKSTWSNIHRNVCEKCAIEIFDNGNYFGAVEDLAVDNIGTCCHNRSTKIIDYKRFTDKKEYISVFDLNIQCSICGKIPNKSDHVF